MVVDESNPDRRVVICKVNAVPKPTFSLSRVNGEHAKDRSDETDPDNQSLMVYRQELHVEGKYDFGEYVCDASNSLGTNSVRHNVTEHRQAPSKPQFLTQPDNNRIVSPNYELIWKVDSDTKIVRFEVLVEQKLDEHNYRLVNSRNYTVVDDANNEEYVGRHLLNNLERDHSYRIVVKAINSNSLENSNEIEFTISDSSSAATPVVTVFALCLFAEILMQSLTSRQRFV